MKEAKLKISVVTVCYNAVDVIEETIQSVVNQTYDNVEYIIIDGGSTDGTVDVIKKYQDQIAHWVSEPDKGIYDAMNKGIDIATGDYIININCGDQLYYIPIDYLASHLNDSSIGICGSVIDQFNNIQKANFTKFMKLRNQLPHQAMFYKKKYQKKYDLNYKILADYNLNLSYYKDNNKVDIILDTISLHSTDGVSNTKKSISELYSIINQHYGIFMCILAFAYNKYLGLKSRLYL